MNIEQLLNILMKYFSVPIFTEVLTYEWRGGQVALRDQQLGVQLLELCLQL